MSKSATVTISYYVTVQRTFDIDAEGDEIDELLECNNFAPFMVPEKLVNIFGTENASHSSDKIVGFPNNISVTADYDDPDDITVSK